LINHAFIAQIVRICWEKHLDFSQRPKISKKYKI